MGTPSTSRTTTANCTRPLNEDPSGSTPVGSSASDPISDLGGPICKAPKQSQLRCALLSCPTRFSLDAAPIH